MNASQPSGSTNTVSLARQPVFDDTRRLWGYELFPVGSGTHPFPAGEENVAISLAHSSYMGLQQLMAGNKKIIIDFNERSLLDNLPYALPAVSTVVKVAEPACFNPDVVSALSHLKNDGFLIAVTEIGPGSAAEPVYATTDIVTIDVEGKKKDELLAIMKRISRYEVRAMAVRVEDPAKFDICRGIGFSLFAGSFFKKPDLIKLRKMTSNEVSRFNLLRLLESPDPDFEALAQHIQTDVSLSFRLLSFLNSVVFGFSQKIKSIRQAISMLGWDKLKIWLRVVLISDMSQHKDAPELMLLSVQRGKFMELVARDHDYWGFNPASLHLLGIFSLLDAMLGIPMADIVKHLPLDTKLKSALCGDSGSEYHQLLVLALLFEEARWSETEKMIQQLNLDADKVGNAFQQAVDWALELTSAPSA